MCGRINHIGFIKKRIRGNNMENVTEIQKRVLEIIKENLGAQVSKEIDLSTDLSKSGIDSIASIKMIVALETEFDFEFEDEMILISKYPTIKDLVDYVESKGTF